MITDGLNGLNVPAAHVTTPSTPYPIPEIPNPVSTPSHPCQIAGMLGEYKPKDLRVLKK